MPTSWTKSETLKSQELQLWKKIVRGLFETKVSRIAINIAWGKMWHSVQKQPKHFAKTLSKRAGTWAGELDGRAPFTLLRYKLQILKHQEIVALTKTLAFPRGSHRMEDNQMQMSTKNPEKKNQEYFWTSVRLPVEPQNYL